MVGRLPILDMLLASTIVYSLHSSVVGCLAPSQKVAGSNPAGGTSFNIFLLILSFVLCSVSCIRICTTAPPLFQMCTIFVLKNEPDRKCLNCTPHQLSCSIFDLKNEGWLKCPTNTPDNMFMDIFMFMLMDIFMDILLVGTKYGESCTW